MAYAGICTAADAEPAPARILERVSAVSMRQQDHLWTTLEECHRILDAQGAVAALREQYLTPLTFGYAIDRLLNTPEVKAGVAENAYLRKQYEYYFKATGFEPAFRPVAPGKWGWLAPLNGLLFSKWSIWGGGAIVPLRSAAQESGRPPRTREVFRDWTATAALRSDAVASCEFSML